MYSFLVAILLLPSFALAMQQLTNGDTVSQHLQEMSEGLRSIENDCNTYLKSRNMTTKHSLPLADERLQAGKNISRSITNIQQAAQGADQHMNQSQKLIGQLLEDVIEEQEKNKKADKTIQTLVNSLDNHTKINSLVESLHHDSQILDHSIWPISLVAGATTQYYFYPNYFNLKCITRSLILGTVIYLSSKVATPITKTLIGYSDPSKKFLETLLEASSSANTEKNIQQIKRLQEKSALYASLFKPTLTLGSAIGMSLFCLTHGNLDIKTLLNYPLRMATTAGASTAAASLLHSLISNPGHKDSMESVDFNIFKTPKELEDPFAISTGYVSWDALKLKKSSH